LIIVDTEKKPDIYARHGYQNWQQYQPNTPIEIRSIRYNLDPEGPGLKHSKHSRVLATKAYRSRLWAEPQIKILSTPSVTSVNFRNR